MEEPGSRDNPPMSTVSDQNPDSPTGLSSEDLKWIVTPEEGWSAMPMADGVRRNNFVSGDSSGQRLTVEYYRYDADGSLRAKAIFGPAAQGPPGHAHGGSMAAVLDEAMGAAAWVAGHMVVAAELTTRFKGMLPLGTRCVVAGRVESVSGRRVRVSGLVCDVEGHVFSEGEAIFVKLREDQIRRLAGIGSDNFFASANEKRDRVGLRKEQDQQSSLPGGGPLA
jgi:acyl-coenzyme A thioesterase PaaI-like protein